MLMYCIMKGGRKGNTLLYPLSPLGRCGDVWLKGEGCGDRCVCVCVWRLESAFVSFVRGIISRLVHFTKLSLSFKLL